MHGNAASFVGEGVDGIFAGSFKCRIERAENGSDKGDKDGFPDVIRIDDEVEGGKARFQSGTEDEAGGDAEDDTNEGEHAGLSENDADDVGAGGAHGFEDPDLAGSLHDCGVHGLEDDKKADNDGDADDDFEADVEPGKAIG